MKTARTLLVSVLLVCLLSAGPAGAAAKRWKMAQRLWRSVKSTMGSGHWQQAEGLLQEFIKKFAPLGPVLRPMAGTRSIDYWYTYVVEGGGNRMLAEVGFLMLQALLAWTCSKKVESERE